MSIDNPAVGKDSILFDYSSFDWLFYLSSDELASV